MRVSHLQDKISNKGCCWKKLRFCFTMWPLYLPHPLKSQACISPAVSDLDHSPPRAAGIVIKQVAYLSLPSQTHANTHGHFYWYKSTKVSFRSVTASYSLYVSYLGCELLSNRPLFCDFHEVSSAGWLCVVRLVLDKYYRIYLFAIRSPQWVSSISKNHPQFE